MVTAPSDPVGALKRRFAVGHILVATIAENERPTAPTDRRQK
jgi:hypothetical protein